MPKLQAVLEETSFNTLDDSLKSFYVQNAETKQFFLDVDNGDALAFNLQSQMKKKEDLLKKAHDEKRDISSKYQSFEALGKTPEEIKAALESNRPEEVTKLVEKYENEKKSISESFKSELEKTSGKATRYFEQAQRTLKNAVIASLRAEFDLTDVAPYVLDRFIRVEPIAEDSDELTVRVYDESGNPFLIAGAAGKPEQLLNGFKEQKKFLNMFNAGTGSGSNSDPRQKAGLYGGQDISNLSPTERLKIAHKQRS